MFSFSRKASALTHRSFLPFPSINMKKPAASLQSCEALAGRMKTAGGDVQVMHLPKMGIKGNSHMLMQDRNNLDLADLILQWIDSHAEPKRKGRL